MERLGTNDSEFAVSEENGTLEFQETHSLICKEDLECTLNKISLTSVCKDDNDALEPLTMEELDMSWASTAHNTSNFESDSTNEDTVYFCPSSSDCDIDDPLSIFKFEIQEVEIAAGDGPSHETVFTRVVCSELKDVFPFVMNTLEAFGKKDDTLITVMRDVISLNVEHGGWLAIWSPESGLMPSRDGNLLVEVINVDPEEMVGHCRQTSLCDQDEDDTAYETIEVCLSKLYLSDKQRNMFDLDKTTNAVEFFRLMKFIFRPWEMELETQEIFPDIFEKRRQMLLLECSSLHPDFKIELKNLRIESEVIHSKLRKELVKIDDELFESESERDSTKLSIVDLQFKLEDMEFQYNRVENPLWRELQIAKKAMDSKREIVLINESYIIVAPQFKISAEQMKLVLDFIQNEPIEFRITESLAEAVTKCRVGVTVILFGGYHPIRNLGGLAKGGKIIGLSASKAVIYSNCLDAEDNWLVVDCEDGDGSVQLENLTIESTQKTTNNSAMLCPQSCILTITGKLDIKDVLICGTSCQAIPSEPLKTIGVWVLPGAKLSATNMFIKNFTSCVVLGRASTCCLTNAEFSSCEVEIEGADHADFKIFPEKLNEEQLESSMSQ